MIVLLQRVSSASVTAEGELLGEIQRGLLVLVGVEQDDKDSDADRILKRVMGYRVFADEAGRMNRSLVEVSGGLLLVPQFTLVADTRKGMRPGFSRAALPEDGRRLFSYLVDRARVSYPIVECGRFGADMQVGLVNDGPVTFLLRTR